MLRFLFLATVSIIGLPLYALCVLFLLALGKVLGWSYVDASVYVCEYFQPLFTAAVALLFLCFAVKKIILLIKCKSGIKTALLSLFSATYIATIYYCVNEFFHRIASYKGLTNQEIFDFVVSKLSRMAQGAPEGHFYIVNEHVSYGYVMANMEVYILPLSIVLICGFIQWRITRRLR